MENTQIYHVSGNFDKIVDLLKHYEFVEFAPQKTEFQTLISVYIGTLTRCFWKIDEHFEMVEINNAYLHGMNLRIITYEELKYILDELPKGLISYQEDIMLNNTLYRIPRQAKYFPYRQFKIDLILN